VKPVRPASSARSEALTEERQARIAECALGVFVEKGFHASTIRDIAAACDMSMGQLYHYISSKDDVLFLVHRHCARQQVAELEEAIDGVVGARERLVAALAAAHVLTLRKRDIAEFLITESRHLDLAHRRALAKTGELTTRRFWRDLLTEVEREHPLPCSVDEATNLLNYVMVLPGMTGWNRKASSDRFFLQFVCRGLGIEEP
jgi:AcrR family transcriptional regulator